MDSKVCRICLNETGVVSVFDKDNDIQYSTKIMRCVNVTIDVDDALPKMLCGNCVAELTVSYEFVNKCAASDKALRCVHDTDDLYEDLEPSLHIALKDEDIKKELDEHYDKYDTEFLLEDPKNYGEQKDTPRTEEQESKDKKHGKCRRNIKRSKMGPIQCVICGLMVISRSAMETHMRTHTGEKPFHCQLCEQKFTTKGALKRHISTYHSQRERRFTCETCGNSFFTKSDIITHMRIHTDEKPYICPFCTKSFRQIASLIRHKRIHTGERPYSCPICDKKFADRNLVKKHQMVHSDERKYSCHLCSKSVKSKTALKTHLSLHSNEKRNICSFCGMAFSTKGNLKIHIRRVHSEKSGECSVCLKTFSDLQEHMRKHTGEKPFLCGMCTQAFATKRSLAHHIVFKHENASKFKCSIGECSKTFPTTMMLEFHLLKQHTNHTPYICQHCSRGFFRTSDLTRHLKISHMELQMKMPLKILDS